MRLINVNTLELEEFASYTPPYAILSHTWGVKEIGFTEIRSQPDTNKAGWRKILLSCKQAQDDGYGYVWCDTCCIDKSSSAELSESINSMFRWYQEAAVCYAFLEDVQAIEELAGAKWFTRGWTLQELIAPKHLIFYNSGWQEIGTREYLDYKIADRTGIDLEALHGADSLSYVRGTSLAKRISWAANRITTRDEDIAYCLMGLLEINMPLLYGEGGTKAFVRLQEECIKLKLDHSFLTWLLRPCDRRLMDSNASFLASHPKYFEGCSRVSITSDDVDPFSVNNKGLQIRLPILQDNKTHGGRSSVYLAVLACYPEDIQPEQHIGIQLHAVEHYADTFVILPNQSHRIVTSTEFCVARLRNCCILRTSRYSTDNLLSINNLTLSLQTWQKDTLYLDTSRSPSTWKRLALEKALIALPNSPEQTSYGILLHPSLPHSRPNINSTKKLVRKILVRIDIGIEKRDDVNVSIEEFYGRRNAAVTGLRGVPTIPTFGVRSKSRSLVLCLSTEQSETLTASVSWIHLAGQDVLFLDIDLTAVNEPRDHPSQDLVVQ
jgi:hypothetical protein